ncbi:Putative siRNA-mediated silencing protein NRDE-2 [Septoria linicola]|uniref:SiRNA-mediated silencing protein NRDE-2 n=1 Tax=Septoria linicola TaxID=215465 RepID=A0A9Q9ASW0_9PEZI|nr:Putative siRNA-mediated silencing protein NRDE-2 [Septoria linicola]
MQKSVAPRFGSFKPKPKKKADDEPQDEPSTRDVKRHKSHSVTSLAAVITKALIAIESVNFLNTETAKTAVEAVTNCSSTRSPDQHKDDVSDRYSALGTEIKVNNDAEESEWFLVDRRGDAKNVEFQSLHRYSVPAYRRIGYGNVIGTNSQLKIDREASTDKEICLMNVRKRPSAKVARLLTSKHGRSRESHYRFIIPQRGLTTDHHESRSDFIDLRSSRKRRNSEEPEPDAVDYRSLEGKAKAQLEDDDLASTSGSDVDDIDHAGDLAARKHNAILSKQTKADPQDANLWLALIEHQAQLVRPGKDLPTFTSSERRTLADLRLSMVGEALGHITRGMSGHERLLLVKLNEGSFIWDIRKRNAQWEDTLKLCPSSTLLWTRYLDHIQDSANGFRFETCRDAYLKCLAILANAAKAAVVDDLAPICEAQIYIVLRYTSFARDAGYSELSTAIWQALLEWSFHMPLDLQHATFDDRISSFEAYWDSECPRVGEQQACSWADFHINGAVNIRKPETASVPSLTSTTLSEVVTRETESSKMLFLPTTADDDAAVEDPFRCVLFSDTHEVLELCDALRESGQSVLQAMLQFFALPAIPSETGLMIDSISWSRDPHLARTVCFTGSTKSESSHTAISSRRETTETIFGDWFPASFPAIDLVDRVLEQLLATRFDDALAEYALAYKYCYFRQEAPRAAKKLLKDHPASLHLYNAYAVLLALAGKGRELQKPLQIWSTSVHMRSSLPTEEQDNVIFLWHSRLLCLARHTHDGRATLASLMTICETSGDANTKQLRVQRELESGFDRMQLAGKYVHASLYADLLGWLAYLTSQKPIDSALSTYQKYADLLSSASASLGLEHLLQHKARLLHHHISQKRLFKPATLRSELEADRARFPSNSELLALRDKLSYRDRLRELVKPTTLTATEPENIVQWSHKLAEELRRVSDLSSSGATKNNVRAHFVNAVASPDSAIKHAPALWMLWLTWEHSLVAESSSKTHRVEVLRKTKQVHLDGLRHIPWHKDFLLKGLEMFTSCAAEDRAAVVSDAELRQWWEVMLERGLRVRHEVE